MIAPPILHAFVRHAARSVIEGAMDYYDAESAVALFLPTIAFQDYDAAFDLLSKAVARYEEESARLARAIRVVVAPMFERRLPAEQIKQAAAAINKFEILSPQEIQDILRQEYQSWKAKTSPTSMSLMTGRTTTARPKTTSHQPHSQSQGRLRA